MFPYVRIVVALLVALVTGPLDAVELQIQKTDATHYTVTYDVIDALLAEAPRLPFRGVPETRGKRVVGVKLLDIKPDSLGAKLGFRDGDVVTAINHLPITGPAEALSAYARTKDAKRLTFSVTRAGKPRTSAPTQRVVSRPERARLTPSASYRLQAACPRSRRERWAYCLDRGCEP